MIELARQCLTPVFTVTAALIMTSCASTDETPSELAQWYVGRHVSDLERNWGKAHVEQGATSHRRFFWGAGSALGTCHIVAVVNRLGRVEAIAAEQEGPNRKACSEALGHMPIQP